MKSLGRDLGTAGWLGNLYEESRYLQDGCAISGEESGDQQDD